MSTPIQKILVLGAYGFFGSRICAALAKNPRIHLILAGRDLSKATAAAYQLGLSAHHARQLDSTNPDLALQLRKLGINVVIHAAGPFQGQGYEVARAAIKAGCNYLDLADGRAFVTGISRLRCGGTRRGSLGHQWRELAPSPHLRGGRQVSRRVQATRFHPHWHDFRRTSSRESRRFARFSAIAASRFARWRMARGSKYTAGSIRSNMNFRNRWACEGLVAATYPTSICCRSVFP